MGTYFFKSRAPFQKCSKCGQQEFGVLMVSGESCVRRCNNCDFSKTSNLPKPKKKLIYLDQNAISLIVKVALDRAPAKWSEVRKVIEYALHMEAIICPCSEFHESESLLDKKFADELRRVYQHFAHGEAFRTSYEIQLWQIARALKRFVKEPEPDRNLSMTLGHLESEFSVPPPRLQAPVSAC